MKVARLHGPGDIRLSDEPVPVPGDGEELVHVDAVGICGSDLHWFSEGAIGDAKISRPLVLGHEMGGTIASGERSGLRVAIDPSIPCWTCSLCRDGDPNLCLNLTFAGHGHSDGGMREFMTWPAERLHPIPDTFDAGAVAALEPLGVALHALDLTHLRLGSTVGVVGCGPIGVLAVQLANLAGADRIVAVDPLAHRRDLATRFGAVGVTPEAAEDVVADLTSGLGLDTVLEIAGTDAAVQLAIDLCRPGARLVLAGIPDGDHTSFSASSARRRGLTIAMSRRMKEVYPRTIRLVSTGRVNVDAIVSDRFDLEHVDVAMKTAAERQGHKVMITRQ